MLKTKQLAGFCAFNLFLHVQNFRLAVERLWSISFFLHCPNINMLLDSLIWFSLVCKWCVGRLTVTFHTLIQTLNHQWPVFLIQIGTATYESGDVRVTVTTSEISREEEEEKVANERSQLDAAPNHLVEKQKQNNVPVTKKKQFKKVAKKRSHPKPQSKRDKRKGKKKNNKR